MSNGDRHYPTCRVWLPKNESWLGDFQSRMRYNSDGRTVFGFFRFTRISLHVFLDPNFVS